MTYRTPKELEKSPVIGGFDLKTVLVIAAALLAFVFTMMTSFIISLIFPLIAYAYFAFVSKFKKEGEFVNFMKYIMEPNCIQANTGIKELLNKN